MTVQFTVNGEQKTIQVPPAKRLIDLLREDEHFLDAKHGCNKGICGACVVLLDGTLVRACLVPAFAVRDRVIMTLEGLAGSSELKIIQEAFNTAGYQPCESCRSPRLLSTYTLLRQYPAPNESEIKKWSEEYHCPVCESDAFDEGIWIAADRMKELRYERI